MALRPRPAARKVRGREDAVGEAVMAVDRCYCLEVRFAHLQEIAEETGADFETLRDQTGCGNSCGLCIPYIRIMLKTGRTDLPVLSPGEAARILAAPDQVAGR